MRTVIAGNGIVALTAALRLAQRGGEVVIVGPAARPGSATLAAPAMLNSFAEIDEDSLASDADRLKFELARAATVSWDSLASELGGDLGRGTGTYVLAPVPPIVRAAIAYREPHAIVAGQAVPGYAGHGEAVQLDREGWIDPRRVLAALERALAAAPNVTTIEGVVARFVARGGVVVEAVLGDGRAVGGTHFVAANGASLTRLLEASDLGIAVQRVVYGVGTTIEIRAARTACLRSWSTYLVPCGSERAVIGATNDVSVDPRPGDPSAPERLQRAAAAAFDHALANAEVTRINVGWRPIPLDTYPLIGLTSLGNLAIASGTRRDGFHLAPLIADHLRALLHAEPTDSRLRMFAPERAPLRTLTRDQAIERAVRAGGDPVELARIHDAAGADTWGIPPELVPVYRAGVTVGRS